MTNRKNMSKFLWVVCVMWFVVAVYVYWGDWRQTQAIAEANRGHLCTILTMPRYPRLVEWLAGLVWIPFLMVLFLVLRNFLVVSIISIVLSGALPFVSYFVPMTWFHFYSAIFYAADLSNWNMVRIKDGSIRGNPLSFNLYTWMFCLFLIVVFALMTSLEWGRRLRMILLILFAGGWTIAECCSLAGGTVIILHVGFWLLMFGVFAVLFSIKRPIVTKN